MCYLLFLKQSIFFRHHLILLLPPLLFILQFYPEYKRSKLKLSISPRTTFCLIKKYYNSTPSINVTYVGKPYCYYSWKYIESNVSVNCTLINHNFFTWCKDSETNCHWANEKTCSIQWTNIITNSSIWTRCHNSCYHISSTIFLIIENYPFARASRVTADIASDNSIYSDIYVIPSAIYSSTVAATNRNMINIMKNDNGMKTHRLP